MKINSYIRFIILAVVSASCSNTRFLSQQQMLYTGRENVEILNPYNVPKSNSVENYVESITNQKINNALGQRRVLPPIGLWVHNYMKPKEGKKFGKWIYKTFSSEPVLISDVNPYLRASKIENELFDRGYFHTEAWSQIDTSRRNPRKGRISYRVRLGQPYTYKSIGIDTISSNIDSLISTDKFMKEIIPGDQFNLEKLKNSRTGMTRRMQEEGYFYIIPEFIELNADTSAGKNQIDLILSRKKNLPQQVLSVYEINDININNRQGKDSVLYPTNAFTADGININSSGDILKPEVLMRSLYFRKGDIYSYSAYQSTITRLNNLGVFKFVNISYLKNYSDSLSDLLDVKIDLLMADNINLDLEADLATKSSGYFGPLLSATLSHGNVFNGAERLKLGLTGGFEWQWGSKSNSQIGNLSYQFGITSGLTLPDIKIPFKTERNSRMLFQRTNINLDLSILNRTAYYKMYSARTSLNYQWSKNRNIQHSYSPVYINSVNLLATTPEFDSVVNENIYIRKSFEEQFIIGMKYEFGFNNTLNVKPNNYFFQGGISTSGNLVDLFAGINKETEERPYSIANNIYSQYLKLTSDFRYYRNGFNKSLVFRLYAGVGVPYRNSQALPYVEQFFSGGAYSIRAFTARYLGPGSFHTDDESGYIDQSGDLKLETNLEYRFDLSKSLKGAFFIETGNIWLVNEDPNRPGSKFNINTFYNELAVGTGFGLRFDFSFFILRGDLGLPIRLPYQINGKNWITGTNQVLSNSIFNLAIGYPF